ncbi:hypothetical protein C1T31_08715 [Hanstruepera neustonica]|uniref:Uncharacterized protein n=1 Tax=Hanstruepera neustonica TaxID=1445657 RepID=A0A2K1DYG6_9FLAO|nr:hypothetical protein [Hanstruepera neustonica]PNQ73066.1 hypothetical protein C1T31_08715 [Hanstruepera neustonica]
MNKINLILLFAFIFSKGLSQNNGLIYPDFIGETLESIHNNLQWKVLVKATGDLNDDHLIDYALVLESKDSILEKRCPSCKLSKQKPRIILVLINENNTAKVMVQNNKFIARGDEGGMSPYIEPELLIENNLLTIFYQFTRSNQSYVFEFNKSDFIIKSAKSVGVHAASGNFSCDLYDFKANIITCTTGHISNDMENTKLIEIKTKPKKLSEFGEMYEWEVVENKYL